MEKHTCFDQSLTAKQLLHGAKGRKTANTLSPLLVGPHWVGPWALVEKRTE